MTKSYAQIEKDAFRKEKRKMLEKMRVKMKNEA